MKTNKPRLWVHGLFLGPSILVFSIGIVAPFLVSCFYSLTDWNGVSRKLTFIGLQNFVDIFTGKDLVSRCSFVHGNALCVQHHPGGGLGNFGCVVGNFQNPIT